MSSRCSHPFFAALLAFTFLMPAVSARAQDAAQGTESALADAATKQAQEDQANFDTIKKAITETSENYMSAMNKLNKQRVRREMTPSIDQNVFVSLLGVPTAGAVTNMVVSAGLEGRYRELNLIPPNQKGATLGRGLVSSTGGSISNDNDNFRIFMDYFCDPRSFDNKMGRIGVAPEAVYNVVDETDGYKFSCGKQRVAVLGALTDDALDAGETPLAKRHLQLIGLPLKPQTLFFEPVTFPSMPVAGAGDLPNTNPLADLSYAGYRYFERLVLGKPADKNTLSNFNDSSGRAAYVRTQGRIARQMMASYPFAALYAERVGTLIKDTKDKNAPLSPPLAAARLLRSNWASATTDPNLLAIIKSLEAQPSMSMAQYMDILMYKVPMSPGYLARINQLTPSQLMREKLFLMGLQNVLKYHVNRWMEMSLAIEAVR